jgi:DNA-binding transcriptional ArsR family regulator
MNGSILPRHEAALYAGWFRALADPTRVQLVAWLAQQPTPVSVAQLTAVLPVGQSTVSHHLAALAEVGFVQVQHRGTSSLYAVNPNCLDCFPTAADVVMGRRPPDPPPSSTCTPSTCDPSTARHRELA